MSSASSSESWKIPPPILSNLAILVLAGAGGFALFSLAAAPGAVLLFVGGAAALATLLRHPELALALYVVAGDVKGDDRIAALLPVDLTLALGVILAGGMALNILRRKRILPMPAAYFLFIPLVALMAASLAYTPVLDAGLEKFERFLTVTGIVIIAPFFVLGSSKQMKRFLTGFAAAAFAICAYSLSGLGGSERLVTPSDNTIGLGHIACALILLVWFGVIPRCSFPRRMLAYGLLAVPAMALVGSGSRGSTIACALVILLSLFFNRSLLVDLSCLAALGLATLPFAHIPESSFEYLGTLFGGQGVSALLEFRSDLLGAGWKLLEQHPLIGAGIDGFRYSSPNAGLYKWPHNIFLEVACEMGIPAGLIVCALFGSAIREAWRQIRDRMSPCLTLSQLTAALLVMGIVNATNTGDINSDRTTWLFMSLVFVVRGLRKEPSEYAEAVGWR
ncbi:MAG: O-antigen ligase family protein [Candidatus Acidiferrales bacterium]